MRKPPLATGWFGDIDVSQEQRLNQDAEFCRRMRMAIETGR